MPWLGYLLRRLLSGIGVLLGVMLLTYGLSRLSDADPVEAYLMRQGEPESSRSAVDDGRAYRAAAKRLGADLPPFFFGLSPKHYPDTLYRIMPLARRQQAIVELDRRVNSWERIQNAQREAWRARRDSATPRLGGLFYVVSEFTTRQPLGMPRLTWYGWHNGFTHFAGGLLRGDLGYSARTGEAVSQQLLRALGVTLPIGMLALLVSIVLGLLIGVRLARKQSGIIRSVLYVLVSAPGFWLATLLVTTLTGRGRLFPGPGWRSAGDSLASWLSHVTLPVAILAVPAGAYLALLLAEAMRRGDRLAIRDVARLHGASERTVWWREMLPLGVVPTFSTAVGLLIPSFIGGFVVVEYVFNIPGLGRQVIESILARDWPVVLGVVLLSGVATILGYLFMDVTNALIDPRFRKVVSHAS